MAAAVDQQASLARCDHRWPERQAGDRAAGPLSDAISECDNAGRTLITLLEPRRDDADHPGVPLLRRCEDEHRRLRSCFNSRDRRLQGTRLDFAALEIVAVEAAGEFGGERRIVGGEQTRSEIGGPYPPPGIDPRAEKKAEMIGVERLADAGESRQRRQAGIGVMPRDLDSLRDQCTVDAKK